MRIISCRHSPLPVWTTAGPATISVLPPDWRFSASSWAIRRMASSFGFSVETALFMKPNVSASRGRSSGKTRTPAWPITIVSPTRTSFIGTQRAVPRERSIDDAAVHLLIVDRNPLATQPDLRPLVRRAIKSLGKGAGDVGLGQSAIAGVGGRGAVIGDQRQDVVQKLRVVGGISIRAKLGSVRAWPILISLKRKVAPLDMMQSRIFGRIRLSIICPRTSTSSTWTSAGRGVLVCGIMRLPER